MNINWKIKRDHYYSELFERNGLPYIEKNGFFFDTALENTNVDDSLNILCTPLAFLRNRSSEKKSCVLLSTGSFCPVHEGHIEIMVNAKKVLEEKGWEVLGGYLSPGHDEYISMKCKEQSIPVHYRIDLINKMIAPYQWLHVDPWEGIFNEVAVNFTDVVYRLEKYIEKHIGTPIPVFFVCGSDNARFAAAFELKGHCVVVNRPGNELKNKEYIHLENERILFVSGSNTSSSTSIREKYSFIPPRKKQLQLRTKDHPLEASLKTIMRPYYSSIIDRQVSQQLHEFENNRSKNIISLDTCIKTLHNLEISREYDIFGINKLGYTIRPGSKDLSKQCADIPKENYYLFDDDIHTGNTMRFAKIILQNHGHEIAGILSLNISESDDSEILDARDFFMGGEDSGLVIRLPNGDNTRALYVYPYVDPTTRCSVSNPMEFSIAVWKMNMEHFRNTDIVLHSCLNQKKLLEYVGFKSTDTLYEICKWHYDLLSELKNL
jgi:nicotinic acid mononucleotide adenylyltransferase